MLSNLINIIWTKRESDRGIALMHALLSAVFFALWVTLRSSYRMDTAFQFAIFWALLTIFYVARGSLGVTNSTDGPASIERAQQIDYLKSLLFAAGGVFFVYRGIMYAMNDKPEGSAIRFLIAALAVGVALYTFPFAKPKS